MFEVRAVRGDEWRLVKALRLAALAGAPGAFLSVLDEEAAQPDDFWRRQIAANAEGATSTCQVAFERGDPEPAGMAVGALLPDGDAGLYAMWVEPRCRRRGLAGELCRAVADWARGRQARRLHAEVTPANEAALRVYLAFGFELAGVQSEGRRQLVLLL